MTEEQHVPKSACLVHRQAHDVVFAYTSVYARSASGSLGDDPAENLRDIMQGYAALSSVIQDWVV